eukprot:Lithocolla_globosa_v1_NODE_10928_length_551_cov_2.963710.p1 type:complete len:107 gc:universal NODE_10928_length_551_cov_2.963710:350-30(-)
MKMSGCLSTTSTTPTALPPTGSEPPEQARSPPQPLWLPPQGSKLRQLVPQPMNPSPNGTSQPCRTRRSRVSLFKPQAEWTSSQIARKIPGASIPVVYFTGCSRPLA